MCVNYYRMKILYCISKILEDFAVMHFRVAMYVILEFSKGVFTLMLNPG